MKDITIVVAGQQKVGKSTVAQIINSALAAKGFTNVILDDDEKIDATLNDKKAAAIASKVTVKIKTVPVSRGGSLL